MPDIQEFEEIKDIIEGDLKKSYIQQSADSNLEEAISSHNREENQEYNKRNLLYSTLLEKYISIYERKEKAKAGYKCVFFWITIVLFVAIVGSCLYSIIMLQTSTNSDLTNIGVALTNVAGIISTIIILPRIIADHLFPTNEESNMLEMVKNMQDNDANIRDLLHKELGNNEDNDNNCQ